MSGETETFRTHASYLDAFSMLCSAPYREGTAFPFPTLDVTLERLGPVIAAADTMTGGKTPSTAAADAARKILRNAWGTEFILAQAEQMPPESEALRIVNNWAVVQAYYAVYHAAQSLIVARGEARPTSHPNTQERFAAMWADRRLDLPPWSIGAHRFGHKNVGGRTFDSGVTAWTFCDPYNCWDLAAMAVRTTRERALHLGRERAREVKHKERRRQWREEERQRVERGKDERDEPPWWNGRTNLKADDRVQVEKRTRTYTVLDYLYRLRMKSNYETADVMLEGPESDGDAQRMNRNLRTITSATLLLHEMHVGALVGRDTMLAWADEWLEAANKPVNGLGRRVEVLREHLPS